MLLVSISFISHIKPGMLVGKTTEPTQPDLQTNISLSLSLSLSLPLSPSLHASLDHFAAYYPARSPKEIAHNPGINEAYPRPRQQCTRFFRVRGTLEGVVLAGTPIPLQHQQGPLQMWCHAARDARSRLFCCRFPPFDGDH